MSLFRRRKDAELEADESVDGADDAPTPDAEASATPETPPEPSPAPKSRKERKAAAASATPSEQTPERAASRFARLRGRLSGGVGATLRSIVSRGSLTDADWEELEETLLLADVGVEPTEQLLAALKARVRKEPGAAALDLLREELVTAIGGDTDRALVVGEPGDAEAVALVMVGVNGVGKTTTAGKLARVLVAEGFSVVMGAADTFRAAAADQLETWGERVGVPVVRSDREGADPASVAFAAAERADADGADVLLIDTAGRLQNKQGLMDELGKLVRVLGKGRDVAEVLLVLDATTGQNGMTQARVFAEAVGVTGIVLTKLDGSAKGGIVIAVQRELGVPVKYVGLGEQADDLAPFDPREFVAGLLGD